jgi:hypothetical protein
MRRSQQNWSNTAIRNFTQLTSRQHKVPPQGRPKENQMTMTMTAMNKTEIIAELENMAVARLFGGGPWLADRETVDATYQKLIQMGLVEQVCAEPQTWRNTPLGKELDVDLFVVFLGVHWEWEVPGILEDYRLLDGLEADAIFECTSEANAESVLIGYVRRAYLDYRMESENVRTARDMDGRCESLVSEVET